MTPEEAIQKLQHIQKRHNDTTDPDCFDTEQDHIDADEILEELVPPEVRAEYNKIRKWYS